MGSKYTTFNVVETAKAQENFIYRHSLSLDLSHPLSKISMIVCSKTLSFITEIHISILFISKSTEWEAEDLHLGDVGGSPS